MTEQQFARLKSELETSFEGARNAGRPLLLEGGLDWKPLSLSPKDMDFMEAKNGAARRTKRRHPQRACGLKAASRVGDPAQDQSKTQECFEPKALFALDPRRRIASGRAPSRMTEKMPSS